MSRTSPGSRVGSPISSVPKSGGEPRRSTVFNVSKALRRSGFCCLRCSIRQIWRKRPPSQIEQKSFPKAIVASDYVQPLRWFKTKIVYNTNTLSFKVAKDTALVRRNVLRSGDSSQHLMPFDG